ncbi:universal stress protein [Planctomycetes bacterium K23_9]|uniref:Universal stress protein n=1 Tax=Stieleria marina TaxID=1930275 RepID=A0A517NRI9_9BACT|nr:Putative universal stress protein [Planctomycetes bacterium K23_9]
MKKIILATDGSAHSEQAATFLSQLPHDNPIELTVVSALDLSGTYADSATGDWTDTDVSRATAKAKEAFEVVTAIFSDANVSLKHIIRVGHPAETIIGVANETSPELLVVGAKGHTTVERILLGSTSDYVATHAPCSVLVVRATEPNEAKHRLRVAIGYDDTGPAQAAVEEFAEFQWGDSIQVRLVTIAYRPDYDDYPYETPSSESVENAAKQIESIAPDTKGCVIESGHIGEGMVRFVEANDVNLLMIGETPRTRLSRMLMGSKTRYVLRHAPCSVWITRNRMIHGIPKSASVQEAEEITLESP